MVADGMTVDEILADLPYLEREDITEALRFAAEAVRERELLASTGQGVVCARSRCGARRRHRSAQCW